MNAFHVPGSGSVVERIPGDEQPDAWEHMLAIQFFEGDPRTPIQQVAALEQEFRGHGGTIVFTVLASESDSALYEFSCVDVPHDGDGPIYRDQCVLARVLRGNDGLHHIAYTEIGRSMDPDARRRMLEAFEEAYVVKNGEPIVLER